MVQAIGTVTSRLENRKNCVTIFGKGAVFL